MSTRKSSRNPGSGLMLMHKGKRRQKRYYESKVCETDTSQINDTLFISDQI